MAGTGVMDRYMLTYEGRARLRRMETDISAGTSDKTQDYELLHYLYAHGAATIEEIEGYSGLSWSEVVNRLSALMYYGYVEGLPEQ